MKTFFATLGVLSVFGGGAFYLFTSNGFSLKVSQNQTPIVNQSVQGPQQATTSDQPAAQPLSFGQTKKWDDKQVVPATTDAKVIPQQIAAVEHQGVTIEARDAKGNFIFYPSYDARAKKVIWIQFVMVKPAGFDPTTYSKPLVVLGHDGYDAQRSPVMDFEMKGKLNYLVKNTYRLGVKMAQQGSLVIIPAYRGENESQGSVDIGGGDVMDTISAIKYLKSLLPEGNKSTVNLVGTSRGALTSVMTASVYPVDKVVFGYGVMDMPNWLKKEANCGTSKDCLAERKKVYGNYTIWDQILDADSIVIAKSNNNGVLPQFTRNGIDIKSFANKKTSFYIGQGLNDRMVQPYHSFALRTVLNKLSMTNSMDVYFGTAKEKFDSTHGIYTRVNDNYINAKRGATVADLLSKFVNEATSDATPTALVEQPLTKLAKEIGFGTLAKPGSKK